MNQVSKGFIITPLTETSIGLPYAIAAKKCSTVSNSGYIRYYECATQTGREKAEKHAKCEDSIRCLIGNVAMQFGIRQITGTEVEDSCLNSTGVGKPYLSGNSGIHFNVSHSHDWVICAFDNTPIGVDVEAIKERDLALYAYALNENEKKELRQYGKNEMLDAFYDVWTHKEAYAKNLGTTIYDGLALLSVLPGNIEPKIQFSNGSPVRFFQSLNIGADYKCTLCFSRKCTAQKVRFFTPEELLDEYQSAIGKELFV